MVSNYEAQPLTIEAPNLSLRGCMAPHALIDSFQLRIGSDGCRRLVPIDPMAAKRRTVLLTLLGTTRWSVVEGVVFDLLDSVTDPDKSLQDSCAERFRLMFDNVLETQPINAEQRNLVVSREKLRMLVTIQYSNFLHSQHLPTVDRAYHCIERLTKLIMELTDALRRAQSTSPETVIAAAIDSVRGTIALRSPTASRAVLNKPDDNSASVSAEPSPSDNESGASSAAGAITRKDPRTTQPRWRAKDAAP